MLNMQSEKDTLYMTAEGKLNDQDYDLMLPEIKHKIDEHGKINWYFRMKNFEGWTLSAFWRDLRFDFEHRDKLNNIAIVGENKWQQAMADVMKPFTSAEIKYFDEDENEKALNWIAS